MVRGCPFCEIAYGDGRATIYYDDGTVMAFTPINPFVPGHLLVIPKAHVTDPSDLLATAAFRAATIIARSRCAEFNILMSKGEAATQTVEHLHVHLLPRGEKDGTPPDWPWQREDH